MPYRDLAVSLLEQLPNVHIRHVPRSENSIPDALATLALSWNTAVASQLPTHLVTRCRPSHADANLPA